MLFNRDKFGVLHRSWLLATVVITAGAAAWYFWTWQQAGRLPGGSSWPGLVCGIAAGLICFFEFALVFKKTWLFRTCRSILGIPLGTARQWMAAHIWLGLLAVPLVLFHAGLNVHTGMNFGGLLSTLLAVSFIIVILSGVFGLVLQNVLPRLLTDLVQEETIYSQIGEVGQQLAADAERLVNLYGGEPTAISRETTEREPAEHRRARQRGLTIVGAPRHIGTMLPISRQPVVTNPANRGGSPELVRALTDDLLDFLRTGRSKSGRLGSTSRIQWYFDDLRQHVRPDARPVVEQLEAMCQRRRQLNLQSRIHFWLHGWLSVHLPLSVALVWLLIGHILGALAYN